MVDFRYVVSKLDESNYIKLSYLSALRRGKYHVLILPVGYDHTNVRVWSNNPTVGSFIISIDHHLEAEN
jgi:hypothetical protein